MSHPVQPEPGLQHTLATLIDVVEAHHETPEVVRREMTSAIRTLAKVLKAEPHMISAKASVLGPQIASALPVAAKVSDTRWRNVKSLFRRALALIDPKAMPARSRAALLPEWATLMTGLDDKQLQRGLARFSKWCSGCEITPEAVTQEVFDAFLVDLTEHCLVRSPAETQQTAGKAWNKAVLSVPGLPAVTLSIADRRKNRSLPWEAFPPTLHDDVDAFFAPRSSDQLDFASDVPTMRASTIQGKRLCLRQLATAAVEGGVDPAELRTLADLVAPKAAKAGLTVLLKRAEGKKTGRIHGAAYLLLSIARHWTKADLETIKALEQFAAILKPRTAGMTQKNRKRLQQFDDPRQTQMLLALPERLMKEAVALKEPTVAAARVARLAVAIEILTAAPLRIGNVAALELGRTLMLSEGGTAHVIVDHAEVKNDVDLEVPLPIRTVRMIEIYLRRFHPLLAPPGCMMLFPSADGGHLRATVLSNMITTCLAKCCGLKVNAHLFRHIAAKIYLEAHPGEYGTVKLLLGHKSIDTTIRAYCGTETAAAFRGWDELLTSTRGSYAQVRLAPRRS